MNEVALRENQSVCEAMTASEIRAQVNRIQEVMKAVMKDGVHYGVIPGAGNKPTLYKPGAEKIFSTFRINVDPVIESETRTPEEYTVRVKAIANAGGRELGSAFGEASSNEEKYKWRRAVCDEEFEDTSEDMRRLAYKKYQGKVTRVKQVRVSVPDISNTILKMAVKRAEVALCLQVTAASDVFDQDIEDLPDGLESMIPKPTVKMPTEKQTPKHQAEPTEPDDKPPESPDNEMQMRGVIKAVSRKPDGSKKPHGICVIVDGSEVWVNTYHKTLVELAQRVRGRQVDMTVKKTDFGFDLVDMGDPDAQ